MRPDGLGTPSGPADVASAVETMSAVVSGPKQYVTIAAPLSPADAGALMVKLAKKHGRYLSALAQAPSDEDDPPPAFPTEVQSCMLIHSSN